MFGIEVFLLFLSPGILGLGVREAGKVFTCVLRFKEHLQLFLLLRFQCFLALEAQKPLKIFGL